MLRERGSSLLPVGITAVEGDFEAGDAVEVVADGARDRQGNRQLLGRASWRRIKGHEERRRSRAAAHAAEEAVHRDHFVLG